MTAFSEFSAQNRGGKGVKCYKLMDKTGNVVGAKAVSKEDEVMMISSAGIIIQIPCSEVSVLGRVTSGVRVMNVQEGTVIAGITKVKSSPADAGEAYAAAEGENAVTDEPEEVSEYTELEEAEQANSEDFTESEETKEE
jgi:DNA gyrase subunit A